MTVTAPYRFAPIHKRVFTPGWWKLASQDVPFADGLDGEVEVTISTRTPTCVGGKRIDQPDQPRTVCPFVLPDDRLAIPKSSLEGMTRSILEVAAFGRLGDWIDERWPGLRDLSGNPTARQHYSGRFVISGYEFIGGDKHLVIRHRTCAGWIFRDSNRRDGPPKFLGCGLSRIGFDELFGHFSIAHETPEWRTIRDGGHDAPARYAALGVSTSGSSGLGPLEANFSITPPGPIWHANVGPNGAYIVESGAAFASGGTPGTVVLTGKPEGDGNPLGRGKKKKEFTFHGPSRAQLMANMTGYTSDALPERVWAAFLDMNTDPQGNPSTPGWAFWESEFEAGRPVPVFWLPADNGSVDAIGMAFMFKAPFGLSTHDLLGNSSKEHLEEPSANRTPDLPELIFGAAALMDEDGGTSGRRGRAAFDTAIGPDLKTVDIHERTLTLSAPKPGYYPTYVRQPGNGVGGQAMAVYAKNQKATDPFVRTPELSGVKIYPAGDGNLREEPDPPEQLQAGGTQTQTTLRAVPKGIEYSTRLRFHNLRPVELGAVLWALRMGLPEGKAVHRLGMGKALGFGEIALRLGDIDLVDGTPQSAESYIEEFEKVMARFFQDYHIALEGEGWHVSPQVQALKKAAIPERAGSLRPMSLQEHQDAKARQGHLEFDLSADPDTVPADNLAAEIDREPEVGDRVEVLPGKGASSQLDGRRGTVESPHNRKNKLCVIFDGDAKAVPVKKAALRVIDS